MPYCPELTRSCDRTLTIGRAEELDLLRVSVDAHFIGPDSEFSGGAAAVFEVLVSYQEDVAQVTLAEDCGITSDIEQIRGAKARRLEGELGEIRADYRRLHKAAGSVELDLDEVACRLGRVPDQIGDATPRV